METEKEKNRDTKTKREKKTDRKIGNQKNKKKREGKEIMKEREQHKQIEKQDREIEEYERKIVCPSIWENGQAYPLYGRNVSKLYDLVKLFIGPQVGHKVC